MEIPAFRATLARLIEEQYRSLVPSIMWVDDPGARFPPHFGKILIFMALSLAPYFIMREPIYFVISLFAVAVTILAIPVVTYLTYRGRSYEIRGNQLIEKNDILGSEKTQDLNEAASTKCVIGIFPRLLGIGKVYILNDEEKVIFQMDYLENPESVEDDVKKFIR